ncbi:Leucine-rich repeat, ribonuclease inhibitor subtype [Quillaja saponaria]|uniref:Leucine-rich repeat, ribonuclease inhibitor subtype n=1 Tax=Quillaja saponaria TaxID=32244 RepID=A0AAD7Q0G4_QUISA|nr:Leucine-rich repeat, ribonuclease inhibitor subtype [Quillaja saponaria]
MALVPSLLTLCMKALKKELVRGDDFVSVVSELPSELLDTLYMHLPPLALHKLQKQLPFDDQKEHDLGDDGIRKKRKCGSNRYLDIAWKMLFKLRWPALFNHIQPIDWQQIYWETHLQNCLDEAAETAVLPSFNGCIGEIQISDTILKHVGYEEQTNLPTSDHLKLSYHCEQFAYYTRYLRLQNVLCTTDISDLLRNSKLQSLVLRWIRSKEHIDGLCKLLNQHSKTLTTLEFVHCKFSPDFINALRDSLVTKSMQTHGIHHFSINTSSFLEPNTVTGLVSFLSSGRSLCSLKLSDNHLSRNFAKLVFFTLLNVSSSLCVLDLSENNIAGCFSDFNCRPPTDSLPLWITESLQSLHVLNLRGNNLRKDDAENLRYALVHMPNLEVLDISDNFIEDEGIRNLIPYLIGVSEKGSPLADLNLENCELTFTGVTHLLNTISTFKRPLKSLSIADNFLGSAVAAALGKFLVKSVQVLNIGGIGLGSSGFQKLQDVTMEKSMLVKLNISKNRGGIETANFLSKLFSLAPELTAVNAAYNLMPVESLTIICSALKVAKGNLQHVDLTGNIWNYKQSHASMLAEFQHNGKPILTLPSLSTAAVPYDDDP